MTENISINNIIVGACLLVLLVVGGIAGVLPAILNDCITRFGSMVILTLAMLPTIRCGMGLNIGLPVGIVCGLIAEVIAIENNFFGLGFLLVSVLIAILIAIPVGYVYGKLMNAAKGLEMTAGAITASLFTVLFYIAWRIILPMRSWVSFGASQQTTISLYDFGANQILDSILSFRIGSNITVPSGTLLAILLLCYALYRFKPDVTISTDKIGSIFTRTADLHVDNNRILASILSTVLGALGIIVYGQSIGYIQLLDALMMTYPAVAAVLIGGATMWRVRILHVFFGTFVFNNILFTALLITNRLLATTENLVLTDVVIQIIQNGVNLCVLVQLCKSK